MSSFEFGGITTGMKQKDASRSQRNPLLFEELNGNKLIVSIFEGFPPAQFIATYKTWIKTNTTLKDSKPDISYVGISSVVLDLKTDDPEKIVDFYSRNHVNFKEVLAKYKDMDIIYVTVRRGIYAVTETDDISISDFYDFIFNKTYFYAPDLGSFVFPIDSLFDCFKNMGSQTFPADRARTHFAEFQFKYIKNNFDALITESRIQDTISIVELNRLTLPAFYKEHWDDPMVSLDIETSSLDFMTGSIGTIQVAFDEHTGYFIPYEELDIKEFMTFISNKRVIGQNLKFDSKYLQKNSDISVPIYSDSFILAQTLCEFRKNGLKSLAWSYTKHGGYDKELEAFKKKYKVHNYLDIPKPILMKYATMDPVVTMKVHSRLQEQLTKIDIDFPPKEEEKTVRSFYESIILPSYKEFVDIEYFGMPINLEHYEALTKRLLKEIDEVKEKLYDYFDTNELSLNLNSSKKLGIFIKNKLKWKDYGTSKAGEYLTGDDQIVLWIKDGNKGAKELQTYRSLSTILKTFMGNEDTIEGWREYLKAHPDGTTRIHASFGVGNAESKRNTCRDPNLQQMPAHGSIAKDFKKMVAVPPPDEGGDYLLGTLDYASFQIRLCALNSNDPILCNIYKTESNPDLHSLTGYTLITENEYVFYTVKTEKGEVYELYEGEKVTVIRNGERKFILAKDIHGEDEFVGVGEVA